MYWECFPLVCDFIVLTKSVLPLWQLRQVNPVPTRIMSLQCQLLAAQVESHLELAFIEYIRFSCSKAAGIFSSNGWQLHKCYIYDLLLCVTIHISNQHRLVKYGTYGRESVTIIISVGWLLLRFDQWMKISRGTRTDPFYFPRLFISIEWWMRRCLLWDVYGKSTTLCNQWNPYVQHVRGTSRSLQTYTNWWLATLRDVWTGVITPAQITAIFFNGFVC